MNRTTTDHVPMPCAFCPQTAFSIDNDGNMVCPSHDEPTYKAMPGAIPGASYMYVGRTRTRERIRQNWPNLNPLITVYEDEFFYTWMLLPREAPMRSPRW